MTRTDPLGLGVPTRGVATVLAAPQWLHVLDLSAGVMDPTSALWRVRRAAAIMQLAAAGEAASLLASGKVTR